ncbi:MAG: hypothetical protein WBF02_21475 [Xanthobacteraceae bacterium]
MGRRTRRASADLRWCARSRAAIEIHGLSHREFPKLFKDGAYPPNTLLIIDRLVREEFLIEVSAVAAR